MEDEGRYQTATTEMHTNNAKIWHRSALRDFLSLGPFHIDLEVRTIINLLVCLLIYIIIFVSRPIPTMFNGAYCQLSVHWMALLNDTSFPFKALPLPTPL